MNMRQQDIAFGLAEKAHAGQFRRDGTTPYFDHVRDVARIAQMRGGDDKVIAAALLHDVMEDCNVTEFELLEAGICQEVVDAVKALTLDGDTPYHEKIKALSSNPIARVVKIADNLSNLSDEPTDRQILKYAKSLQILLSAP